MTMYTDYKILVGSQTKLAQKVNSHMLDGWIPLGSVSVTGACYDNGNIQFTQAMVKER